MFISFSQIFLHPFHFANVTHHGKYQTYQFSRSSFPKKYISGPQKKKMNITIIFLECFQSQKGQINFPIAFNIFELVLVKSFILNRQNHFLEQIYSKRVFSV